MHHLVLELTEDPQATQQLRRATGELDRAINEISCTIFGLHHADDKISARQVLE